MLITRRKEAPQGMQYSMPWGYNKSVYAILVIVLGLYGIYCNNHNHSS